MSERKDGDRITVTGYSGGSHFPRTQAATQYRFEADGLSSEGPYHIDGSIYGRDILFRGPGSVLGPVMARGDARVHNHSGRPARLLAGLHVSGNIGSVSRGGALEQSLVASLDNADCVIRGDAIGENVHLENAIVVGNVRGRHVKLTHCIVLGQIIAEEAAVLQASTFASYQCRDIVFEGPCTALFSLGVSERPPEFRAFTDGAGKAWPSDLRFYPAFRSSADGAMSNRCWRAGSREYAQAALSPSDWVAFEATRTQHRVVEGKRVEESVRVERYAFTVAGRALNFSTVEDQVARLASMLKTSLEFNHYSANDQQAVRRSWEVDLTPDEARILRLATDLDPLPTIAGTSPDAGRRSAVPQALPARDSVAPPAPSPAPVASPVTTAKAPAAPQGAKAPLRASPPAAPPSSPAAPPPPSPPSPSPSASLRPPPPSASLRPPPPSASLRPPAPSALRAVTQAAPAAPKATSRASEGAPPRVAKILFRDGNQRGGRLGDFEPERGVLKFLANDSAEKRFEDIALDQVLAVLVGRVEGVEVRPAVGALVRVDLGAGRKLTGHCADPNGAGPLWLVPPDRTGPVDAVWIDRSAVVSLQPAET